jgi:hypothetical protein
MTSNARRALLSLLSALLLSGCEDRWWMSKACRAVLELPRPVAFAFQGHSEVGSDGVAEWTVKASNPGPLHLVFDLSRDRSGLATAPIVHVEPGGANTLLKGKAESSDGSFEFASPRFAYTHGAPFAREDGRPVTLRFPVQPDLARFTQTPTDGNDSIRPPSHTAEAGNFEALDINAPLGTPILAPADGVVVRTYDASPDVPCDHAEHVPYGNVLVLATDDDVTLTLAHLAQDSIIVEPGARVRRGEPVAQVGMSGGGGVAHIHLLAEALGSNGIDSIPIRFEACGDATDVWTPRNGPACR